MKTAIVYYSLEGNTEYTANKIAEKTGADLIKISPVKEYPSKGIKKFLWGGKSAVMSEKPKLNPYNFEADNYERVIIGFPVSASTFAPPIRSFVCENSLKSKKIAMFACQAGNGAEKAFSKLKELIGIKKADAELILVDPKANQNTANEKKIEEFCKAISD